MQHDIAYDDLGFLDTIVDYATAPVRYAGKAAKAVAKAILPDDVVDFVADIVESAWDFGEDVIVKQLDDPKTWMVVGAAVATVATGGVAAPLAMSVAAETLAAKAVTGIGDKAFSEMSSKAKAKLVDELKRKNPQKWAAGVHRAEKQIARDPRWEKARTKAEVAALSKAGIELKKYGKLDTNPVFRDYRAVIDAGGTAKAAMEAAKARSSRIDGNRAGARQFRERHAIVREEKAAARQALPQAEAAGGTDTAEKSGPPMALIAGGLAAVVVAAVVIARTRKARR